MIKAFKTTMIISILLLAGCNFSISNTSSTDDDASLSLYITDAPTNQFSEVWVTIERVILKPEYESTLTFELPSPKRINLLKLQRGRSEQLLNNVSVPEGKYEWMSLKVDRSTLRVNDNYGREKTMALASTEKGKIFYESSFIINNSVNDMTLDFDVKKSIIDGYGRSTSADYVLLPSLRLVRNTNVGDVSGRVDYSFISQSSQYNSCDYRGSVYIFENTGVKPVDMNVYKNRNPLAIAQVSFDGAQFAYTYKAAFIPEGGYTIAYTCQSDDNEQTDDLQFIGAQNITIVPNQSKSVNF